MVKIAKEEYLIIAPLITKYITNEMTRRPTMENIYNELNNTHDSSKGAVIVDNKESPKGLSLIHI